MLVFDKDGNKITAGGSLADAKPERRSSMDIALSGVQRLIDDPDLRMAPEEAAGVMGSLWHESGGFRQLQEIKPVSGRGGFGWAQWTGPRRRQFEEFTQANNLDPRSDEANFQFLKHELINTPEGRVLAPLRQAKNEAEASDTFTNVFERPGVPALGARRRNARQILAAWNGGSTTDTQTADSGKKVFTAADAAEVPFSSLSDSPKAPSATTTPPPSLLERGKGLLADAGNAVEDFAYNQVMDPKSVVNNPGQTAKNLGSAALSGVYRGSEGVLGTLQAGAEVTNKYLTGPVFNAFGVQDPVQQLAQTYSKARQGQKTIAERLTPKADSDLASGVYSGMQSITQNLMTIPAAVVTGNPLMALAPMGVMSGGQSYGEARDAGKSPERSALYGTTQGIIEVGTETIPMGKLLGSLKANDALWKTFAKQLVPEMLGEQAATFLQDLDKWVELNPDKTAKEFMAERPSAAVQTAVATLVGTGGQVLLGKAADVAAKRWSSENKIESLYNKNPMFMEILKTETDPSLSGIERAKQARDLMAQRLAAAATMPAERDQAEDTSISSTGIPGDPNAQDPAGASTAPAEPTGTTQAPIQEGQPQTVNAAQGPQVTPDIAPEIRQVSDNEFQIVDTNTGTVISQHPTDVDAFEALDQLNASTPLSTGIDRETTTATQETTNEGQNQEANAGTSGQEGLLKPLGYIPEGADPVIQPVPNGYQVVDANTDQLIGEYQSYKEAVNAISMPAGGQVSAGTTENPNANDPTTGTGEIAPGTAAGSALAQGTEGGAGAGTADGRDRPEGGSAGGNVGATATASTAVNPVSEPALERQPEQNTKDYWDALDAPSKAIWADELGMDEIKAQSWEQMPVWVRKRIKGLSEPAGNKSLPTQLTTKQESEPALVLQNRNRSNPASVQQMQSIAGNPDYLRLSPSRNFADGAPVIAGGQIPAAQMGRKENTVTAKGRRIPVQYAVVEADSVLASNNADGTVNAAYGDTAIQAPRAIAGNGRIAGLQKAYRQGSAQQYQTDLAADDLHGISPDVISGMKAPVLVRVMPESELTQDIGDESNIAGGLSLSPVEQARNDAARLDLEGLDFDEDGTLGRASVLQFVRSMPESEQGGLLDADGTPNRQAHDRLNSAVFQKAYENDELVRLHAQAVDPDAKLVMSTLSRLAPKFSRLKGKGLFDTRGWLADAAKAIVNGRRRNLTMQQIADQQDMDIEPQAYDIIRLFADSPRSNKAVIEDLSDFADFAYNEATRDTQDMFGETPRATQNDLRKRLENYRERRGQKDLAKRSRDKSVSQRAEEAAADAAGPNNAQETAGGEQGLFAGPTAEDRARADREALAEAQKEQQRKSNATQAPPADDGLFALDNRQDQLKFSLRPDEQQQRIRKLNRGIDAQNRRYAGGSESDARSRVELAAAEDVPAARRIEWKLASAIAAVFKHSLIPVRGENGGRLNFDGVVDPNGDPSSIFITVDSVSPISRVVAHELLHGLRLNAPKIYDNLVKSLRQLYDADALVDYVNSREYAGELTDANEEEWVADFVSNVINSPDGLVRVAFAMNRNKAGSGFNFLRRVQGLVERIKQGLAGTPLGANKVIAKSDLQKAEDAVVEALAQYAAHQEKGTQPSGPLKFSNRPRDPGSATSITGDLARVNEAAREAAESRLSRLPAAEQQRVRQALEDHKSTPWAAAAIKGMVYREMLERARAGQDISALEVNPVWGNQNMANTKIIKAFKSAAKRGDIAVTELIYSYDFIGNNRKAEKDISTSFTNCDPSKACAEHCYAADANARPNEIAKSEFTEYALENFPDAVAKKISQLYAVSNLAEAGLALRLNDKGDLSDAQVRLVESLNERDIALQVFSKRPELLRGLPDINLKMLSVDSTNIDKASGNPDLQLAVTTTDGMTEDMLAPIMDRVAVVLPVNLKGVTHSKDSLREQFPNLAKKIIDDSLCPVEIGTFRTEPGTSFVTIEAAMKSKDKEFKKAYKGIWTCTACDKLGTVGCFHGDRQTSQRKAAYLYDNGMRKQAQIRQIQKDIEFKMDELAKLGIDIGDFRGELHKRLSAAHDAGQSEVRAPGAQGEASRAPGEADAAAQGDAGSRGASGSNAPRRRFTLVRDDGDLKFSNRPIPIVEEPLQDDLFRQQLDLFLDSDPAGQSGPKTQAAKQSAVSAVETLRRSDRGVLGARLADTYAARQRVSLVGHTLTSREDLATLAQVYRDTRFETFRLFFTNQEGKIVSQVGLTSRLPASSAVIVGTDVKQYMTDLAKAASKVGATHYYMLHNHPSTNPMPSEQDVRMTQLFDRELNLISNGHVVIDTNQFGFIKPSGDVEIIKKDFGQVSPYKTNEFSDTAILNPESLIEVAKKLEVDQDAVTLVVTTAQQKVLGVTTVPADTIRSGSRALRGLRIRKILKSMSGARVFAVGTHRPTLLQLGHLVMDAIHINESGEYVSVNKSMSGAYGMADPFEIRGRQIPRVTADTSPEFDYLRDQTLMARGGGMGSAINVSEPKFSNRPNPTFYSQLARGFESSKMNSMPGSQWRAWLFSNKAKLGIKDDEIAWTGIEDYLTLNAKEKLTKADIASYLADNGVQVEDAMKGGDIDKRKAAWSDLIAILKTEDNLGYDRASEAAADLVFGSLGVDQVDVDDVVREKIRDSVDKYRADGIPPKYDKYTIPGGQNYRELLITLPWQPKFGTEELGHIGDAEIFIDGRFFSRGIREGQERSLAGLQNNPANAGHTFELRNVVPVTVERDLYKSSHWDEKNVLAHIRFDERTDADGQKVMFIQELQSDWGQEGKKRGFATKKTGQFTVDRSDPDTILIRNEAGEQVGGYSVNSAYGQSDEQLIERYQSGLGGTDGTIPQAPFVTDTKSWLSLGLKRAIRYAAENGFDKIAFANGQQNADLYDLSKQVNEITAYRDEAPAGTVYDLTAIGLDGRPLEQLGQSYRAEQLEDVVGKDLAEKIINQPNAEHTYSGLDLKVGGSGMRTFYDKIVPSVANEVLKKLGGGRVGKVYLAEAGSEPEMIGVDDDGNAIFDEGIQVGDEPQPGFDITPALQDKALSGMPLFSNRRNVLNQPALATWTTPDDSKLDNYVYLLQDKHIDTKRIVEKLGSRVSDAWDPYLKETLYHGRAAKDVDDFKVNEIKPLLQAMSTRGITIGELETFLHNRHAKEANEQIARINEAYPDGGSGILTQDAQDYLANLPAGKRTDLEAMAAQIDAITAGTRRLLVDSGLETQDTIDAWEATYADYVPLQRESEDVLNRGMGTGQGFSTKGPASKRRTGSGKNVVDIMANVMMQRERAITRAEKNKVGLALYGLAIQNPNPGFWYPVNPDAVKKPASVAQELVNNGMLESDLAGIIQEPTVASVNPRTGLVEYKINPALRNRDNVLAVRIKGKDRFLFFSTENERAVRMAQSLKNLDAPEMHGLLNAFRYITRYVSSINTQYNPIFGVVNLLRDTQGAMLNLSTTPIAGKQTEVAAKIAPAMAGIYGDLRADRKGNPRKASQWSHLWEEFQTVGGKTGYRDMYATADDRMKALEKELKAIQEGKVKRLTRGLFDWLSDYNETLENAVRLSAYKVGTENGMTKEQAAVMAKELTVNFNRKGQIASQAGALYAFFNAAVQGTARLAETVKGPAGKKIVAGGLIMGVVQAMMMAAAGYDDDEPPEFLRERNFIIPMPNGKYVSIPMPLGFHVLPNTGRVLTEIAINPDGAGKKIAGLLGSFFEAFNPIGSAGWSVQTIAPTFADPLVALSENRDSFGKEIAKKDRSSTSPTPGFSRTKDTASWLSKRLAWGLNRITGGTDYTQGALSPTPDQLDYVFSQATGGVGREAMKIEQAASAWMTGEELPPYKYPLGVGRFVGDVKSQSAESNRFYANLTRLNELESEIKGRAKDGKDVAGFLRSNPLATLVPAGNQMERAVSELRSRKRKLIAQNAPKATIKALEGQIATQMQVLNDRVKAVNR